MDWYLKHGVKTHQSFCIRPSRPDEHLRRWGKPRGLWHLLKQWVRTRWPTTAWPRSGNPTRRPPSVLWETHQGKQSHVRSVQEVTTGNFSPDTRMKCWQLMFLQTTVLLTFVHVTAAYHTDTPTKHAIWHSHYVGHKAEEGFRQCCNICEPVRGDK